MTTIDEFMKTYRPFPHYRRIQERQLAADWRTYAAAKAAGEQVIRIRGRLWNLPCTPSECIEQAKRAIRRARHHDPCPLP